MNGKLCWKNKMSRWMISGTLLQFRIRRMSQSPLLIWTILIHRVTSGGKTTLAREDQDVLNTLKSNMVDPKVRPVVDSADAQKAMRIFEEELGNVQQTGLSWEDTPDESDGSELGDDFILPENFTFHLPDEDTSNHAAQSHDDTDHDIAEPESAEPAEFFQPVVDDLSMDFPQPQPEEAEEPEDIPVFHTENIDLTPQPNTRKDSSHEIIEGFPLTKFVLRAWIYRELLIRWMHRNQNRKSRNISNLQFPS